MRHPGRAGGGSLAALTLGPAGQPGGVLRLWPAAEPARREAAAPPGAFAGDPGCEQPPAADGFEPHGAAARAPAADGAVAVAVVGHGAREAVELFVLRGAAEAAALRWTGCVSLPPDAVGNDVIFAPDDSLLVTNYQPALGGLRGLAYTIAGGLGWSTGEVLRWRAGRGWESVPATRGANPNGLLLAPDAQTLFVAMSGSRRVAIRPLAGAARDIRVDGHPDNLSWSPQGKLLAALHTSGFAFLRCRFGALPCRSPWSFVEIDPGSGQVSLRFEHAGSRIGGVASVAEVGDYVYFGAVFDDRIGVRHEPRRRASSGRSPRGDAT
jgi:hypothetical protein